MHTLPYRYHHSLSFTLYEYKQLLLTSIAAAFILSFRKWGGEEFNFLLGFLNLVFVFIVFILSLYLHTFVQKLAGLKVGYFPTYRAYPSMLVFGIVLAFLTDGYIPFFIPGCLVYTIEKNMRLGKLRQGQTLWEASLVSFSGPLTNILIALILGVFYQVFSWGWIFTLISINLFIAAYSMIPFPQFQKLNPVDLIVSKSNRWGTFLLRIQEGGPAGLHVFMHNRSFFVLTFSLVLFYSLLILLTQTFALILCFILSIITALFYYYLVEKAG
ncbi:MAG TPA: hypothetical protein VJG90_02530 [Candidatus Nanoarchaeia archaeon]|nr:hypothetical protein [Candidatus Nanoarchaeia archaeon]